MPHFSVAFRNRNTSIFSFLPLSFLPLFVSLQRASALPAPCFSRLQPFFSLSLLSETQNGNPCCNI
jgi:hypothetical protein